MHAYHQTSTVHWESRLTARHALLFLMAVAFSLLLHIGLFYFLPALPAGRSAAWPQRSVPTVLGDVQPEPAAPAAHKSADRFRPETPEAFATLEPMQRDLLESWQNAADAQTLNAPPPQPAITTPPESAAPEEYSPAGFREDILLIEQQRAREELAALPRRVVPVVPRVSGAPDITLPAAPEEIAAAAASASPGDGLPRSAALGYPGGAEAEEVFELLEFNAPDTATLLAEQGAHLTEPIEAVTDITPIESLLHISLSTYYAADEDALYFEAAITRAGEAALPILPKDVLLIQDSSESITRSKLDFFKAGIREYLPTLTTADRVNFMKYAVTPEFCFPDWQPVTSASLDETWRYVSRMTARGQTDLFTSLQEALQVTRVPGRPVIAVLMTDGRPTIGTLDASDIIARFSRANRGAISVFTIGGGERVNSFLLDLLAYNNRGDSWILARREQLPDGIKRVARELSRPVLANLTYRFTGADALQVHPHTLTHLYLDRPLRLIGRAPGQTAAPVLQIIGESGAQRHDIVFPLDFTTAGNGGEGLRREWVMQRIYQLVNDRITGARQTTLDEIHTLSRRHNVPLPWSTLPLP